MTQEERRLKRQQDTKKAVAVLAGLTCVVLLLIAAGVLGVSFLLKQNGKPDKNTQLAGGTETETQTEGDRSETEIAIIDPLTEEAIAVVAQMSLEQKVAQMFIVTPNALTGVNGTTVVGNTTKTIFAEYPVGGLIYEKNNFKTKEQTQEMLSAMEALSIEYVALPIFLGITEEGGNASVISAKSPIQVESTGNMSELGAGADSTKAYAAGQTIGTYLSELGFNMNFAPVADVLLNTENAALSNRSFGSDAQNTGAMVCSVLEGLEDQNIIGVVKYFPGYGSTGGDGTNGAVLNERTLEELKSAECIPFQQAIDADASFIMVGHVSLPNVLGNTIPSSMSEYMITQVLRTEMGFDGVVVTDAMNKKAITDSYQSAEAAVTAIAAGADMILMPDNFQEAYAGVLEAVQNGMLSEEQINAAVVRIVKAKLGIY